MAFPKSNESLMNESVALDQSHLSHAVEERDPNFLLDPKNIEDLKVKNLQTLLNSESQHFLLNLCTGVKDPKQLKKTSRQELERIREEGA